MIREKTIARVFAAVLLIGLFSVGYVLLTQPTGMIAYQTQGDYINDANKEKISNEEVVEMFDEEFEEIKDKLIILGEELE